MFCWARFGSTGVLFLGCPFFVIIPFLLFPGTLFLYIACVHKVLPYLPNLLYTLHTHIPKLNWIGLQSPSHFLGGFFSFFGFFLFFFWRNKDDGDGYGYDVVYVTWLVVNAIFSCHDVSTYNGR